jgi:hypothetical protein
LNSLKAQDIYETYGIYRNPLMVFMNKFSWTLTTGYGATNYSHSLQGFTYYQDLENQFISSNPTDLTTGTYRGFENWLNNPNLGPELLIADLTDVPFPRLNDPVNNPLLQNNRILINSDSVGLGFSAVSSTIPVLVSVHYDINKFRIGLGFQYEKVIFSPLKPSVLGDVIRPYTPDFKSTSNTKIFGILGYKFHEYWDYSFVAELQVGRIGSGKEFNTNALGIGQNLFINLGINIEKNLSEYVRVVLRPSYDFRNYTVNIPSDIPSSIQHNYNMFAIQIGISINIPEIPRTPYESDHVQVKHVITTPNGDLREARGQPMWKVQNPKVGQNHRKLWRYKFKNKRKIDPY